MVTRRSSARKKRAAVLSRSHLGGSPAKKSGAWVVLVLGALVLVNLYVFVWDKSTSVPAVQKLADSKTPMTMPSTPLVTPTPIPTPTPQAAAPTAPPGVIDGKVAKSDTLGRVLKRSGLSAAEADEVIHALAGVLDFKTIRAGQTYRIERGPDGRVRLFELVVSKLQKVRAERGPKGELVGKSDAAEAKLEVKAVGGRIDQTLYGAIKTAGESPALVDFFVDVFAYDLDFYNDTHEGDTFKVVVEKETGKGNELLRYKKILAAEYRGKAGTFRVFWFEPPGGKGNYFTESGESAEKTMLKTPLKFTRVTSGFDRQRMHPVLHTVREHLGIDYAAPTGTPVWAAAGGTITQRGEAGGAGNLVIIRHDGGIETAYMHLSKFAAGQQVGQHVDAKTVIGYVGATGLATGPHLHFGVRKDGAYVDPTRLVPVHGKEVAATDRDAFKASVDKLSAQLAAIAIPTGPALAHPPGI
jgi:murein DD-endopeptidase MepM/ murein hydrolase activator NlpD